MLTWTIINSDKLTDNLLMMMLLVVVTRDDDDDDDGMKDAKEV